VGYASSYGQKLYASHRATKGRCIVLGFRKI
jgi:hypothetical protein